MMESKLEIAASELFPADIFPEQFALLFEYVRAIPDDEEVDYDLIKQNLIEAGMAVGVNESLMGQLDWMEKGASDKKV